MQTRYAVRRLADGRFWTGAYDGWAARLEHAQTFEFVTTAVGTAALYCRASLDEWETVPVAVDAGVLVCR